MFRFKIIQTLCYKERSDAEATIIRHTLIFLISHSTPNSNALVAIIPKISLLKILFSNNLRSEAEYPAR